MKIGDLVRYVSSDQTDCVIGLVLKVLTNQHDPGATRTWVGILWSADEGTYYDEVYLSDLEVISE